MKLRWTLYASLAVLALGAALGMACGDDDDATPTATSTSTTSGGGGGSETNADKAYVMSVCTAFNTAVSTATAAVSGDPALATDPKKISESLTPVIENYVKDLEKAKPPADYAAGHTSLVDSANGILTKLKNNQVQSLAEIADLASKTAVPKATLDRINAAAKAAPECASIDPAFFGQPS